MTTRNVIPYRKPNRRRAENARIRFSGKLQLTTKAGRRALVARVERIRRETSELPPAS